MDPDQTAPTGAVLSVSVLFVFEASHILVDDKTCALRVNKCEFSVYTDFHEMHARLRGPSNLSILHQIINIT